MYLTGDGMVPTLLCPVCEAEGTAVIMDCFLLRDLPTGLREVSQSPEKAPTIALL